VTLSDLLVLAVVGGGLLVALAGVVARSRPPSTRIYDTEVSDADE
jgi:hypothetical protein